MDTKISWCAGWWMIATRQKVYRVLRAPHHDAWFDEAIVRFADAIARVGEATFRLADRSRVRDEARLCSERAATTHRASSHVIRRRVALMRLSLRTRGARDCMNGRSYTMLRRSSLTMRRSGQPAYRMRPRGEIIRHDGGSKALRVEIDATASSQRLHRAEGRAHLRNVD
jgi:hypothetical protein